MFLSPSFNLIMGVINHKNKSGIDSFLAQAFGIPMAACGHSRLSLCSSFIQGSYQGLEAGQVPAWAQSYAGHPVVGFPWFQQS